LATGIRFLVKGGNTLQDRHSQLGWEFIRYS
jgi:hypothetical protein